MGQIKEPGFTYTVSDLAIYNVDAGSPGICAICDNQAIKKLPIHSQNIPICQKCIDVYSEHRIVQVLLGFFKLAEQEILHRQNKKREAKNVAREAGRLLGKDSRLTVRLVSKNFKFTVQILDISKDRGV